MKSELLFGISTLCYYCLKNSGLKDQKTGRRISTRNDGQTSSGGKEKDEKEGKERMMTKERRRKRKKT